VAPAANNAPANNAAANNAAANAAAANNAAANVAPVVAGFQQNNAPVVNGMQTLAGTAATQSDVAVAGVQTLPATSTVETASLAGAGLALIASGGSLLVIKRRRR
jgi:LPXTG-motif cell wall-anchored protein